MPEPEPEPAPDGGPAADGGPCFHSISDAELSVLECLWCDGPASPRELRETLASEGAPRAYTTVQTLLHRLLRNGYVRRDTAGSTHAYSACQSREELLLMHMDPLADRVCDGATTPLMLSMVQGRRFTCDELARFRELLDDAQGSAATGPQTRRP